MTKKSNIKKDSKLESQESNIDMAKELEALKKELVEIRQEAKKNFSDSEKKAIEEARDEMLTDDELGYLYIDEKYKEEGYTYRIVDVDRPYRVQSLMKKGYEIVYSDSTRVGDKTTYNPSNLSSMVQVNLGINSPRNGVLMKIPTDLYDRRQQAKVRRNRELNASLMQDMVNKSDFGTIEIGSDVYKK